MGDIAIRVEGISKRYRIGQRETYKTLRGAVAEVLSVPLSRLRAFAHGSASSGSPSRLAPAEWIWALSDVSFEMRRGDVLGIIGQNGAGKSTLLKILSRITEPTTGYAEIHGRVGSLLEVGTGFNSELTGRENVYLNGAILGMTRAEIARKFDEIVAFAEIEKFMDTPVKHYSSGMYMRLAFAVAAHLEPEILIVDEVLAVGDAAFQKKCLGKMGDAAHQGRTILFVSHNMAAVQVLCNRAIWLQQGKVVSDGQPSHVTSHYLQMSFQALNRQFWPDIATAPGNDKVRLRCACVRPRDGSPADAVTIRTPLALEFEYWNLRPGAYLNLSLHLYNEQGIIVFNAVPTHEPIWQGRPYPQGLFRDVCYIPGDLLNDGMHRVELLVVQNDTDVIYRHDDALVFDVRDDVETRGAWYGKVAGAVRPILEWSTELVQEGIAEAATT